MTYSASASVYIDSPREKVWDALTKPEQVKEYFFGTDLVTTWEPNTPIFFRGEWDGKTYEDKGTVVSFDAPRSLSYTYWSSMSGTSDSSENYQTLRYELAEKEGFTEVTIFQEGVETQEKADHSSENWNMVLEELKKYVEGRG